MSEGPLPLWSRAALFLMIEGFLAWRLVLGLLKRRFDVGDEGGLSTMRRDEHPIRYWCRAVALAGTMIVFGWTFDAGACIQYQAANAERRPVCR